MFFMMGIVNKEKKLDFDQLEVCRACGRYGHLEVYMTCMVLSLFFIPVLRWKKRYYVRMTCCGAVTEIDKELGRRIEKGLVSSLDAEDLHFYLTEDSRRHCSNCGFTTEEDYAYCPRCGKPFGE
ncbi:MAG: zinc ribbon domain-containing protein [Eubacterium sp.]|nr:zinc ribbon domain-containing protein [Eubacterium sp.]